MPKDYSYFTHPSWRRVVSQLRDIFNELHTQVDSIRENDEKFKSENLSLSDICLDANQKYINVIENETQFMKEITDEDATIKESFKLILKVWKLCQIIFIKSSPSGVLLLDLQEWYQSTCNIVPLVKNLFSKYESKVEKIYQDQDYWILILTSIAQSRIDTARHLLSFHPSKGLSAFKAVDEQLRTMPNFNSLGHLSLFEFKAKWEYWQKKCIQVLTNENFACEETGSLEMICKMLCADETTFMELEPIFNSWYYMLISLLSYSNPTFNISDLHLHLSTKTYMKRFENKLDEFDTIIHNIFDFNVESVIESCVDIFSNNLFSAHLMDILYLNGKLQLNKHDTQMSAENPAVLHEQNLSAYANQLLAAFWPKSCLSMYQIAFDYLLKCKIENYGIELIESHLEKIPLTYINELEANKIFHFAYELNFHDLAFSIGRIMQIRALKKGQYGTSLGWNVRIKDPTFGTLLAEKIVEQYFRTNDMNLLDLTDNLSKEIIYCDRLIFLSKYREFLKLTKYSTKTGSALTADLKQATSIIIQLLEANNLVPIKYRRKLILDVLPLIKENVLSEEQIFTVLRSIQNYENRLEYFKIEKLTNKQKTKFNLSDNDKNYPVNLDLDSNVDYLSNYDKLEWQNLLVELSVKLAESLALKSIEISS